MHREYRPEDLHHLDGHAVAATGGRAEIDHERALVAFTALLGALLGSDALLYLLGWQPSRPPLGLSLSLIAALLGTAYIVYGALQALVHRRIGADFALAQAAPAGVVPGQPFVAGEVVVTGV